MEHKTIPNDKASDMTKAEKIAAMAMQGFLASGRRDLELFTDAVDSAHDLIDELNKGG